MKKEGGELRVEKGGRGSKGRAPTILTYGTEQGRRGA